MRSTRSLALAMAAGGAAMLASRGDLAASGTIDTSGATITIGDAPVQGAVTTDESASLGNLPSLEPPRIEDSFSFATSGFDPWTYPPKYPHAGLGGTEFRAQVDLTYPGGTYDYGSFTVDRGVTVRFTGPVTLRATNEMRIEGRIEMAGAGVLTLDCAGDVTIVGRDDAVTTGLFTEDDDSSILLAVGGVLDVSADAGAHAYFQANQARGGVTIFCDKPDYAMSTSIADAVLDAAADGAIYVRAQAGVLTLTNCTTTGAVASVWVPNEGDGDVFSLFDESSGLWADTLVVSGGSFAGCLFRANFGLRVKDGASFAGGEYAALYSSQGDIHVEGGSSIGAEQTVQIAATGGATTLSGDCEVRTTGSTPDGHGRPVVISAGQRLTIGQGVTIEDVVSPRLVLTGSNGIDVSGTVYGSGAAAVLYSQFGDVAIEDGADVDAPNGTMKLWAAGAVTAAGGTATLSAKEYDVRCVTGDLDLDVATMEATAGRIVAMSNGPVKLRGTYRAAGDVQVISLADAIDVHGATLETSDATSAPSGFIRMATYAATSIDAGAATLTTGASDAQSGDVLIQVEEGGSTVTSAVMKVGRVVARRTPDGITTQITGTISAPGLRRLDFTGSAHLTAGALSRRLFLQGISGRIEGTSDVVTVRLTRLSKTRLRFYLQIREAAATTGEQKSLRISRAGFHADGSFRRPKAK